VLGEPQGLPEGGGSDRGEPGEGAGSAAFLLPIPPMQRRDPVLPRSVGNPANIIIINNNNNSNQSMSRAAPAARFSLCSSELTGLLICRLRANPHLCYDAPQH